MECDKIDCRQNSQEHKGHDEAKVCCTAMKEQKGVTKTSKIKLKDFSIKVTPLRQEDMPKMRPNHRQFISNINIDGLIFCDDCDKSYHGDCPVHGPLIPLDESRGWDQDSKFFTSVPVPLQVTVKMSSIMNAGKGVFAKEFIPRRTRIGPYKGEVVQKEDVTDETDTSYFWEVKAPGDEGYYIDGLNEEHASWLRFINCARNEEEQNLLSFQYQGNIYCYTIKDILPGTELLVWYGEQYVKLLGITVDHMFDFKYSCFHCQKQFVEKYNFDLHLKYSQACRDANPQVFKCGKCGEVFTTLINLQQHIRRHEQNNHPTSTYSSSQKVSNSSTSQTPIPAGNSEHFQCQKHRSDMACHIRIRTGGKPYKCKHCPKSFASNTLLASHIRTHTGEKPYQCHYCSKLFTQTFTYRRHLRIHTGERPYQCSSCPKAFKTNCQLKRHLHSHTRDKPYQCRKAFTKINNFRKNQSIQFGEKPYQCQYSSKGIARSDQLQNHWKADKEKIFYRCLFCFEAFSNTSMLEKHQLIHKTETINHQGCSEVLIRPCALKLQTKTLTKEKPFKCKQCSKEFSTSSGLFYHKIIHSQKTPYQCKFCPKAFGRKYSLNRHMQIHTRERPHKCKYCSKTFTQSHHLRCHLRNHTLEKPYQCQHCEKCFTRPSLLKQHIRVHTGEKPFQCQQCSKAFTSQAGLRYHMTTHGVKPYKSQHEKSFSFHHLLRNHLLNQNELFKCQYCSKTFRSYNGLHYHLASHSSDQPHKCQYCSKGFSRLYYLKRHMKTHRNTDTADEKLNN